MDTVPTSTQPSPTVIKPSKKLNPLIFKAVLLLAVLGILILVIKHLLSIQSSSNTQKAVSPNILDITQPVFNVAGTIDKINGDTLILKVKDSKASYQVVVTSKTNIYLGITRTGSGRPTIKDLKEGEEITATSSQDLRTFSGDKFEALFVTVLPIPTNHISNPPIGSQSAYPLYIPSPQPKTSSSSASSAGSLKH